jgi:hypothetical protein
MVIFYGGRKTGEPGEKPSWPGRGPTNNSTQLTCSTCIEISRENFKSYSKPKYMVDGGHFNVQE